MTIEQFDRHPFYLFCRNTARILFYLLFRIRIVGLENIPKSGPVVISCNHIHNFDPPLVGVFVPRFVHFMAKSELFRWRWSAWVMKRLGAFPVKRGGQDMGAMKHSIAIPNSGGCIVVFPEGHRSKDGKLGTAMTGVAFIARKANCPIVPIAIIGPYKLFRPLTIRVGEPFLPFVSDDNDSLLERLMLNIQILLHKGHDAG